MIDYSFKMNHVKSLKMLFVIGHINNTLQRGLSLKINYFMKVDEKLKFFSWEILLM